MLRLRRVIMISTLVAVGVLIYKGIPDVKRYLQIRAM